MKWDRFLPKSQAKQALLGGGITLILLGIAVLYGTSDARHCGTIVDSMKVSVEVGAWRQAQEELTKAKAICGGRRADEIADLERKVAKADADDKAWRDKQDAVFAAKRAEVQAQMDAALRVWKAYEALPIKTVEKLQAALIEANAHASGLPEADARELTAANMALARKHATGLLKQDGYATGPQFTTFVPARGGDDCPAMALGWLMDPSALQKLGFKRMHCDGKRYKSTLTGEMVQEPPMDWAIPDP